MAHFADLALGEAERNLGRWPAWQTRCLSPHILVRPFIRREAVLSSRIEGTRASLVDLYHYESAQNSFLRRYLGCARGAQLRTCPGLRLERSKTLPVSLR